jgi:hypothetical protein
VRPVDDQEMRMAFGPGVLASAPLPRVIAGLLLFGAGLVLFVASWLDGFIAKLPILLLLGGLGFCVPALGDLRRHRRLRRQLSRAKAELSALRQELAGAAAAQDRGSTANPTLLLQQRGYSEFVVRRWILKQLDERA